MSPRNTASVPHEQVLPITKFHMPFLLWGVFLILVGSAMYLAGILFSLFRIVLALGPRFQQWNEAVIWYSGVPVSLGLILFAADLFLVLPHKRRIVRWVEGNAEDALKHARIAVALTAYNDEESIGQAVRDFREHPRVQQVIVVSNNSVDRTMENASEAGAVVFNESRPGYGNCVYRCLQEGLDVDADLIVLCEGDLTFRARDIDKFLAYLPHAELVNGTRIVEQLRAYNTQLSTFMYYGNFFVGKLLEVRHLGRGTFTDVGTTYKAFRREALQRLMPLLNPNINLEFNAHLMDTALSAGIITMECPVTFHPRVGESKGGNVNNLRALKVGLKMILGITLGWPRAAR